MRKFIIILLSIIGIILLTSGFFIAGFWLKYRSIVDIKTQQVPEIIISEFPLSAQVNPFIGPVESPGLVQTISLASPYHLA